MDRDDFILVYILFWQLLTYSEQKKLAIQHLLGIKSSSTSILAEMVKLSNNFWFQNDVQKYFLDYVGGTFYL